MSVSEMLQPMFATCLVRSQTSLLRNKSIREAWGLHRNELLIIIHHYSSLHNSLLIITYQYSNSITHHFSSLLIITQFVTHHYSSLRKSLLIITQIALLIITHHYTTSDGWKIYCVVWRLHATKLSILGHYAWKSRGG